jgi:hypothetical protein
MERRKEFESDPTCCGNSPLQAPQRRCSRSLVGGELRETNPCIFVWFASLSCFSSTFDLLPLRSTGVCYLCVQGSLHCLWSSTNATRNVWFVLEVKRSWKLSLQVLCATLVWPVIRTGLTGASCEGHWVTGLTSHHHRSDRWALTTQVFGEEKLKSIISPINPPLGVIKVLSTDIKAWACSSRWLKLFFLAFQCSHCTLGFGSHRWGHYGCEYPSRGWDMCLSKGIRK